MNDFADFDPGAWRDAPRDLVTWLDDSPVFVRAKPPSTLKNMAVKAALAVAMGMGLSGAFMMLEPHSTVVDHVALSPPAAQELAPAARASMFSAEAKTAGWEAAIALLRAAGEDVPALLRAAAANVAAHGHGDHEFPAVFPKDEC